MKLEYLGHSCFLLESSAGTRIVTDPYGDVGFSLPARSAHAVTVSHGHFDHCNTAAVGSDPCIFDSAGRYAAGDFRISSFESFHDDAGGRKRGKNLIFRFEADGLTVCHLGDIGEVKAEIAEKLAGTDVLLIPVGGVFTIDAEGAARYVEMIRPAVVLPMHYMTAEHNFTLGGIDRFLRLFPAEQIEKAGSAVTVHPSAENQKTKIIYMERAKV